MSGQNPTFVSEFVTLRDLPCEYSSKGSMSKGRLIGFYRCVKRRGHLRTKQHNRKPRAVTFDEEDCGMVQGFSHHSIREMALLCHQLNTNLRLFKAAMRSIQLTSGQGSIHPRSIQSLGCYHAEFATVLMLA